MWQQFSVNHRLNVLGYLDLLEYNTKYKNSANIGIMDLVAALEWIRDNIDEFGGDSSNVTILENQSESGSNASPLAGGRLTRELDENSLRYATDEFSKKKYGEYEEYDKEIILRVKELAEKYNVEKSNIALAWLFSKNATPIIGATKISHLEAAVNALKVKLTDEDIAYLEEMYIPHKVIGAL